MPATVFSNPIFPGAKVVTAELTVTNTSGSYSNTVTDNRIVGSMKPYALEIGDPSIFNDKISITTNAGSYTVACSDVAGETTIKISFLKIDDDPTAVTSTEYDLLDLAKVNKTDVANNLTTATEGKVLDARQGKVLSDQIKNYTNDGVQNQIIGTDLNTLKTAGRYFYNNTCTNRPSTSDGYIDVYVFNASYAKQIAHETVTFNTFIRYCNNGTWSSWEGISTSQTSYTELVSARITMSTTSVYLDKSFTLTRPSVVIAVQNYNNAPPKELFISRSSTNSSIGFIECVQQSNFGQSVVLNTVLPAGTYYLWGSANAVGGNDITVRACGI